MLPGEPCEARDQLFAAYRFFEAQYKDEQGGTAMQNRVFILAAVVLLSEFSSAQVAPPESPLPPITNSAMKLADATPVLLRAKQGVSSATAKVGDRVPFRVTEDVKLGILIVVRRGTEAWGVVTNAKPKARKGLAGILEISIQSTQLLTGEPVPLRAVENLKGVGRSMKSDSLEALADSRGLALPLLPLIRLEKGKDVSLDADSKITAYVNGDVALDRAALESAQPPVVHRTGPASVVVFRPSLSWGSLNAPSLYCGKVAFTRLWNGRYLRVQLPPGKYFFQSSDNQAIELHLEEGQEIYIQMQMAAHGLGMKGHLVRVSNGEGEDEVAHLKEMNPQEVTKVSGVSMADLQATGGKK